MLRRAWAGGAGPTRYPARVAADGTGGARLPVSPAQSAVDPAWLAARAAADTSARAATLGTLLPELINYLIDSCGLGGVLEIIDLGAGTVQPTLAGTAPRLCSVGFILIMILLSADHCCCLTTR